MPKSGDWQAQLNKLLREKTMVCSFFFPKAQRRCTFFFFFLIRKIQFFFNELDRVLTEATVTHISECSPSMFELKV